MMENLLQSCEFRTRGLGSYLLLVSWECWDNGKENGNYYNGLYRNYNKDPFLHP